jgi:predicted transcriptional regulator
MNIVYTNKVYFEIIGALTEGDTYPTELATKLNKQRAILYKQIEKLKEVNFIQEKKEKLLNKTIYSLNYPELIKKFLEHRTLKLKYDIDDYINNKYITYLFKKALGYAMNSSILSLSEFFSEAYIVLSRYTEEEKDKLNRIWKLPKTEDLKVYHDFMIMLNYNFMSSIIKSSFYRAEMDTYRIIK